MAAKISKLWVEYVSLKTTVTIETVDDASFPLELNALRVMADWQYNLHKTIEYGDSKCY